MTDTLARLGAAIPDAPMYWTVDPPVTEDRRLLPYPTAIVEEARRRGFAGLALDHRATTDELIAAARMPAHTSPASTGGMSLVAMRMNTFSVLPEP